MIYTVHINTDLKINTLEDLVKLKPLLEEGTLKIKKVKLHENSENFDALLINI